MIRVWWLADANPPAQLVQQLLPILTAAVLQPDSLGDGLGAFLRDAQRRQPSGDAIAKARPPRAADLAGVDPRGRAIAAPIAHKDAQFHGIDSTEAVMFVASVVET